MALEAEVQDAALSAEPVPAGWYPDPTASTRTLITLRTSVYKRRWWDGTRWTQDCEYDREPLVPEISWPLIGGFSGLFLLLAIGQGILGNWALAGCYLVIGLQYCSWGAWAGYYQKQQIKVTLYELVRRDSYSMLASAGLCFLIAGILLLTGVSPLKYCFWLLLLGAAALIAAGYNLLRSEETFYKHTRWGFALRKTK